MRPEDEPSDDAPRKLVSDLRALFPAARVPAEVDEAILGRARATLAARRRKRTLLRLVPLAAAATLVLWLALGRKERDTRRVASADVDGSGRVDIVDAYVLALRIEDRPDATEGRRFDQNGDGELNRRDVDLVASAAVRVGS